MNVGPFILIGGFAGVLALALYYERSKSASVAPAASADIQGAILAQSSEPEGITEAPAAGDVGGTLPVQQNALIVAAGNTVDNGAPQLEITATGNSGS